MKSSTPSTAPDGSAKKKRTFSVPPVATGPSALERDGITLHPRSIVYLKKPPPKRLAKVFSAVRDALYFNPPTPEKYRKDTEEEDAT